MARDLTDLLDHDETIVLETRQHWYVMVRSIAVPVLLLAVLGLAIWLTGRADWLDNTAGDWLRVLLWVALAGVAALVAWRVVAWLTERLYVTTSKVVYAYGILNRNVTTTPLVKIHEMTLRRPLMGRMLGFGRLDVENAGGGSEPLVGLEYLPRPTRLYQIVSERSRNQRMLEGGAHRDEDRDGLVDHSGEELAQPDPAWRPPGDATSR